jgi:hypothetical protein
MATMELKVTIANETRNTMTYVSGDSHLPREIGSGQKGHCSHSSSWSAISNQVEYQIDPSHQAHIAWYIQLAGPNSYNAQISPDDGRYSISRSGDDTHCYHCDETWTVRQNG